MKGEIEVNKKNVINYLEEIAVYMELKGENPFKISAFRKAARALETDDRSMNQISDPAELNGIGKGTAAVINEIIASGESETLESLKKDVPKGLVPLLKLPGLGGKKIAKLYHELGVVDMKTLEEACKQEKIQELPGFGKKSEEKILAAIDEAGKRPERLSIAYMLPLAERIEQQLENIDGIERFARAGSLRRIRETIKDLDFIIATTRAADVSEALVSLEGVSKIVVQGETKITLEMDDEYSVSVDFRIVKPEEFASTLHHFTGSKNHNVKMRQIAKLKGEKISEYGVESIETGEVLTFEDEKEFYNHFGLAFIPPEIREDSGEIEAAEESEFQLVSLSDIKGDLHMHSTWSDGAYTIEEMAERAREKGYSYIAITDHSQYLKVANGLTPDRLREQRLEINRLNEKWDDFKIFSGVEMDILPDGTLDYDDELLEEMDFVIASIHSSFNQDEETIMARLETALRSHHVDLIAHPSGRLLGRRKGYALDHEKLIALAKETNTALELNANPNRLDLAATWLRKAQEEDVKIMINTDAHHMDMLEHMEIGVSAGRRGWLRKESVINTFTAEELEAFFNRHK
ncbi:DNA polymerase/3'-5' exonuclease PolX [Guptibacillus algicola]|uniref:DNA polymerase/3'-5' exonuclease PolX n=1 Tax=Guptibacillus algicola TaxID=225844 RepID=UPI001CD50CAD|nr:DNA polymerase/3'-5' exonuclease PolX [Alkalihalobacillus algicola]MCA0986288.1 DNA polymerase/3'-5' exonuclease PolX [Alkalihalobacillus algicola]